MAAGTASAVTAAITTAQLRLSSGNGPVERTVLVAPPRDATPIELPIIDVAGLASPMLADRQRVADQIRDAAMNTGFFYVANTGIPAAAAAAARDAFLTFFRQSMEKKLEAGAAQSKWFNGYKPPKTLRLNPFESVDVRESFSWQYDPKYDESAGDLDSVPPAVAAHFHAEEFVWDSTSNLPELKEFVIAYWRACLRFARSLIRAFALSLDLPEDFFDSRFKYPDANLTCNYYPSLEAKPPTSAQEGLEVSIGSHTDFQLFTLLWQDEVGGLQVLNRQGQWINAKPIEGTLVVNIADYMQRITNDRYVSTVHRAINTSGRERISIPFFFGFGLSETCSVLESCVPEGEKPKYETISCSDWVRRRVKEMHRTQ